jgi:hypothetical protein
MSCIPPPFQPGYQCDTAWSLSNSRQSVHPAFRHTQAVTDTFNFRKQWRQERMKPKPDHLSKAFHQYGLVLYYSTPFSNICHMLICFWANPQQIKKNAESTYQTFHKDYWPQASRTRITAITLTASVRRSRPRTTEGLVIYGTFTFKTGCFTLSIL